MIFFGLGSNLGDRKANLEAALRELSALARVLRVSSVYESAALLPEGAPPEWDIAYYNIVASAESDLEPQELLAEVKRIEQALGRRDVGRWGPRVIDIDILAHGEAQLADETLTLPHAGMLERDFVMVPLAEISPHWRYPAGAAPAAHEVVRDKGMGLGETLMRLHITLDWRS